MKQKSYGPLLSFTIIELLIVVAMVSILVAIFFPAIRRLQEESGQSLCVDNLRHIYTALQIYHGYNEAFPLTEGTSTWVNYLHPYTLTLARANVTNIFLCPADSRPNSDNGAVLPSSYALNTLLIQYLNTTHTAVSKLSPFSDKVMVVDSSRVDINTVANGGQEILENPPYATGHIVPRHNFGANYLYADGRIEYHTDPPSYPDAWDPE